MKDRNAANYIIEKPILHLNSLKDDVELECNSLVWKKNPFQNQNFGQHEWNKICVFVIHRYVIAALIWCSEELFVFYEISMFVVE